MTDPKQTPSTLIVPEMNDDDRRRLLAEARSAARDELVSAIVFALCHKVKDLTWKRGHEGELASKFAAEAITDQLILSNFKFYNGRPAQMGAAPPSGRDNSKHYEMMLKAPVPKPKPQEK